MASYAGSDRSNSGRVLNTDQILAELKRGKDGQVKDGAADAFLDSWFKSGGGITAGAAKKYQAVGSKNQFKNPRDELHSRMFGENPLLSGKDQPSANVKGLKGVSLPEGSVYFGSAAVTTPRTSSRGRNEGYSSSGGQTSYIPGFAPRELFEGMARQQEEPAAAKTESTPYQPAQSLANAREAYDRSSEYLKQNGSAASPGFDANLTGGDLLNSIASAGQGQVNDYKLRFLPHLKNTSILQSEEIRNATGEAIAGLDPDLKLPEYTDPFRDTGYGKRGDQTLFSFLSKQIT